MKNEQKNNREDVYELNRLKNFPISFFSISLGLIGFTLAWQKAEQILEINLKFSSYLLYLSLLIIVITALIYISKLVKYPSLIGEELRHPIKINFFPIIAKIFLITSIIYLPLDIVISKYLWWIGVVAQFIFSITTMSSWIRHTSFEIPHLNPSWFIPVVGSIIVPIAGVTHFSPELSWFFFSIGFFWWLILTVIVVNRIIFFHPIPDKLLPTMFILFAPPIIGFISLTKLVGVTYFGNMLYYFGLFMFILVIAQLKTFLKIKFYLSWWAYSFPLDALVIGTLLMYHETGSVFFRVISWGLLLLLNFVILLLGFKTIIAIKNKQICIEE